MTAPKLDAAAAEAAARAYVNSLCGDYGVLGFAARQTAFDDARRWWAIECEFSCMDIMQDRRARLVLIDDATGKVVGARELPRRDT